MSEEAKAIEDILSYVGFGAEATRRATGRRWGMSDEAKARFYFPGYFDVNGFPLEYNTVDALRRATALYDAWNQRGEVARLRAIVSAFEGAIDERYAASAENSPERAEIKTLKDAVFQRAERAITKEDGGCAWDAEQAAKWPGVLKPTTTPAASDT